MNDQALRQDVLDELNFDPSIDSSGIGVSAHHGVVTLTGHVSSFVQRFAAERAAWRVKGAKAVAQELEVRLPSDKKLNDDEIAERALKILGWSASVPEGAVRVAVSKGLVTLMGAVDWHYQRAAAEKLVRRLSGVTGVFNGITLRGRLREDDVRRRIVAALERHADVEASRIRIEVREGLVVLEGEVDDWDERNAVERAAWSAPGVIKVEDHLRIR